MVATCHGNLSPQSGAVCPSLIWNGLTCPCRSLAPKLPERDPPQLLRLDLARQPGGVVRTTVGPRSPRQFPLHCDMGSPSLLRHVVVSIHFHLGPPPHFVSIPPRPHVPPLTIGEHTPSSVAPMPSSSSPVATGPLSGSGDRVSPWSEALSRRRHRRGTPTSPVPAPLSAEGGSNNVASSHAAS